MLYVTALQNERFRVQFLLGSCKLSSDLLLCEISSLGVHSASNTNKYHGIPLGIKWVRGVELTTMPSYLC